MQEANFQIIQSQHFWKKNLKKNSLIFSKILHLIFEWPLYIYIYIFFNRQAVSLYHNSSAWLATQGAPSWDRNLPNFTQDMISNCSAISATYCIWIQIQIQSTRITLYCIDYFPVTIFTNPSARAGYDTRLIFKRRLTGLNSEFSFS